MRTEIPLLDDIKVAAPCYESWNRMEGDDRVRFCQSCKLNVYNLSAMTRREAEDLLQEHEGRLCVRYYRRHDGTILTENCPVGLRRARKALLAGAAKVAASLAILWQGVGMMPKRDAAVCESLPWYEPYATTGLVAPQQVMGDIAVPAPPQGNVVMGAMAPPEPPEVMGRIAPEPIMGKAADWKRHPETSE